MLLADTQPVERHPLGALTACYGRPWLTGWQWFWLGSVALAALLSFWFGLYRTALAWLRFGPAAARVWGLPWFALAASFACLALGIGLWFHARRPRQTVWLHRRGLYIRERAGREWSLTWRQIEGVAVDLVASHFLGWELARRAQITVFAAGAAPLALDSHLPDMADLADRLKAGIYPRRLPGLRAALGQGNPLQFGPVTLQREVIHLRGQRLPWEQVSLVSVCQGMLMVELQHGKSHRIPVREIPNIELLIQLIREGVTV